MSGSRTTGGHPGRSAFTDKIGNCETVEQLVNVVRDLIQAVPFRSEIEDGGGKTKIKLDKNLPQGGSPIICRTIAVPNSNAPSPAPAPSTDASGTISQDLPQINPSGAQTSVPAVGMCIRGFNNYEYTTASTHLDSVAYAPRIPSQELFFQVNVGDKVMYGRVPLMDNPDEGVPRPLLGWTGNLGTTDTKLTALLQMHNDLVQSLLKMGVLRPVERPLSDTVNFGDLPH